MGVQSKEAYRSVSDWTASYRHFTDVSQHRGISPMSNAILPEDGQASYGSKRSSEDLKALVADGRRPPASHAPFCIKWSGA
jgi:hypothetical protein